MRYCPCLQSIPLAWLGGCSRSLHVSPSMGWQDLDARWFYSKTRQGTHHNILLQFYTCLFESVFKGYWLQNDWPHFFIMRMYIHRTQLLLKRPMLCQYTIKIQKNILILLLPTCSFVWQFSGEKKYNKARTYYSRLQKHYTFHVHDRSSTLAHFR